MTRTCDLQVRKRISGGGKPSSYNEAGLWYLNIHTEKHQPGEIRGQLIRGR